ncbi:hypothetical protein ACFSR9_12020 [Deinococcus taklimakanensis]|uniref:Uncharacterized protein n=1 Tax=Deinococcus taklimakanensis TaxID=536443 RepID=A0ABW5P6Q1_9DEIO
MPRKKQEASTLEKLLARVTVVEDATQDDAATFAIDRVTRTAVVTVNPDLADAEAQHGYLLRGAAQLALSGFGAYHNDIQRQYGKWPKEQKTFDQAQADAMFELEGILALAHPYAPADPE